MTPFEQKMNLSSHHNSYLNILSKTEEMFDNFRRGSCPVLNEDNFDSNDCLSTKKSFLKKISKNCQKLCKNDDINILVIGDKNVGKSALTVRFLTRRFIGDYMTGEDQTYVHSCNNNKVVFLDTSAEDEEILPFGQQMLRFDWCDAIIVVYDVGSISSFQYAKDAINHVTKYSLQSEIKEKPILLIGNKTDVINRRSVSLKDAQSEVSGFPKSLQFCELSAAEDYDLISKNFNDLIISTKNLKRSQLLSKLKFRNVVISIFAASQLRKKTKTTLKREKSI